MQFIITQHAKDRLMEREIPEPKRGYVHGKPSKRISKVFRTAMREHGRTKNIVLSGYVYFFTELKDKFFFYVCSIKGIAQYVLITAIEVKK